MIYEKSSSDVMARNWNAAVFSLNLKCEWKWKVRYPRGRTPAPDEISPYNTWQSLTTRVAYSLYVNGGEIQYKTLLPLQGMREKCQKWFDSNKI